MTVCRTCCWLVVLVAASAGTAAPEPNSRDSAYQRGVRAYFDGNCAAAESLFVEAIAEAPRDPRPRYFHGLCLYRLGRGGEARSDFQFAAILEARSHGSYPVGKSLERVQGSQRWLLEQYRWRARTESVADGQNDPRSAETQATWTIHTDVGVLRQRVSLPLERLTEQVSLAELAAAGAAANTATESPAVSNPFADDARPAPAANPQGKVTSGKLLGILGRAIVRSSPVPSVDSLQRYIPGLSGPSASDAPPGSAAGNEGEAGLLPTDEDPFAEPAIDEATTDDSTTDNNESPASDAAEDDDSFGGF